VNLAISNKKDPKKGGDQNVMGMFQQIFAGDVASKLRANPTTAPFMSMPDFVNMITEIKQNPSNLQKYMSDQRVMAALGVLMGIPTQTAPPPSQTHSEPKKETKVPEKQKQPQPQPEPMDISDDHKKSEDFKNKGNEAYKKKEFDDALKLYDQALQIEPSNIVYLTNKAAAHFEMGKLDECIADCEKAIDEGRKQRADYKLIAKAYSRMGNAYLKMEDYSKALEAYNKSLTEDRTPQTLELVHKTEKLKQEQEKKAYINPQLSIEHKDKGNQWFKEGKFPEAVKEYSEAIKRNPDDHVLYSNRAACYTKLAAYGEGLKDCETCIRIKPDFVKIYSRKGHLHFFLKEYPKALEAYDQGLKVEPNNEECSEGARRTLQAMNSQGGGGGAKDEEGLNDALRNPEVQEILSDPVMRQILSDMQTNPGAVQEHLKSPMVREKIEKLISAGVLKVGRAPGQM